MADDVKNLLLQVDASVELMRRNLAQGIGSLNQFEREATRTSDQASAAFARIDKAAALARTSIVAFVGGIGIGVILVLVIERLPRRRSKGEHGAAAPGSAAH